MEYIIDLLDKNGLIVAFLVTGIMVYFSEGISVKLTNKKLPGSAIAIFMGLVIPEIIKPHPNTTPMAY